MAQNFWKTVNQVIEKADILLEVIDARDVATTRNIEIENKVEKSGKLLIYVLNKCDLVDKGDIEKIKRTLKPCVFVSAKEYHGFKMLKDRIIIEGKRLGFNVPRVGVLGYPNMGKSSIINVLKGKKSARTSAESGFTKGKQLIVTRQMHFIDTPGVIPYKEKDEINHAITGINTKIKEPDIIILQILEEYPGIIEEHYGVETIKDIDETLNQIAIKLNYLVKGGMGDINRVSKRILKDFQSGEINLK